MNEETKPKKQRRTLTYADRLKELDEAFAARSKRDDQKVADAEEALADAKQDRMEHRVDYDTKRAEIVNAALALSASIKAQVGGEA